VVRLDFVSSTHTLPTMPAPKRTSRVKFIWPVFKLGGAYFRSKDPWVSVGIHLPLHAFGRGCLREFEWYFDGVSTVEARDVPGVCDWLRGCEYVGDEHLFHYDDFWQHPCTFEQLRRGDCEDHALWAWRKLCEMGIRAEFVCGRLVGDPSAGQSGHAWVVFHDAAGSYVLDPVIKDVALMVRPLDSVKADYIPEASVDQQYDRKMYGGLLHRVIELGQERQLTYSELRASEAAVNQVILLAMAIFFMLSLETRAKRRAALKALHRLRSIVHIVDMHQLTKDPGYLSSPEMATPSSPERSLTRFELARYLDYCSELFSLTRCATSPAVQCGEG
jgi:hypothetical protein